VVEDVTAGEFPHEVGGGVHDLGRAGKDLRSIAVQPEDLRADRLARQRLIAVLDQRLFAYLRGELLYLGGSACINAVKHCVHQRRANRINGQHTRADGTARHRPDVGGSNAALRHQLSADCSEIIPPILAGAVLGPTRLRHDHAVGTAGLSDCSAALVDGPCSHKCRY